MSFAHHDHNIHPDTLVYGTLPDLIIYMSS
jgi:hypothetical protein